jgi:hypothetical protein
MIAVFRTEGDLLAATRAVRDRGCEIVDVYTPYAVHGLDQAMGLRPSRLTWVCFGCGVVGATLALWFQFWTSAVDWPINVGGKPFNSLPAFVPVIFEVCVLLAGLGVVAALLARCRLWPGRAAPADLPSATDDRFVLVARTRTQEDLRALFEAHHAESVGEEEA